MTNHKRECDMLVEIQTSKLRDQKEHYERRIDGFKNQFEVCDVNITIADPNKLMPQLQADFCKVCFTNKINTAAVPCGHMAVCLECSRRIRRNPCAICGKECKYIQTFKP